MCPCLHVRHISNCMATYVEQGGPFKEPSYEWLAMPSVCVWGMDLFKDNDIVGKISCGQLWETPVCTLYSLVQS